MSDAKLIQIIEGKTYTTKSGICKVTTHHDFSDEIYGIIYDDNMRVIDYFKTNYSDFCNNLVTSDV